MRAIVCREHGDYRKMAVEEAPSPPLPDAGVRVAVEATGVSFANLLVIEGKHQNTPDLPMIPGTEVAGVVSEVADGVSRVKVGDRVAASVRNAGFAEEVTLDDDNVYPIPDAMDFATATQFPTIYSTGHAALAWRAGLRAGETLLVHGAAGGSGLAAVEIGKALGARVIAVAGGVEKTAAAGDHGADHVIDHRTEDIRQRVLALTEGRGVDVVYDPVGGDAFDQSLRCIAPGGRLLVIGFAAGRVPQVAANILLVKSITLIGLNMGHFLGWGRQPRTAADIAQIQKGMDELFSWYAAGKLNPHTHATFAYEDFAEALDTVAQRRVIGKVVLVP